MIAVILYLMMAQQPCSKALTVDCIPVYMNGNPEFFSMPVYVQVEKQQHLEAGDPDKAPVWILGTDINGNKIFCGGYGCFAGGEPWGPPWSDKGIDVSAIVERDWQEMFGGGPICEDNHAECNVKDNALYLRWWGCHDKSRILLTSEDGKHWCHKVQP